MEILVNGKNVETSASDLAALIDEMEIPGAGFAVAVRNKIVSRADWKNHELKAGDDVMIISATRGG